MVLIKAVNNEEDLQISEMNLRKVEECFPKLCKSELLLAKNRSVFTLTFRGDPMPDCGLEILYVVFGTRYAYLVTRWPSSCQVLSDT